MPTLPPRDAAPTSSRTCSETAPCRRRNKPGDAVPPDPVTTYMLTYSRTPPGTALSTAARPQRNPATASRAVETSSSGRSTADRPGDNAATAPLPAPRPTNPKRSSRRQGPSPSSARSWRPPPQRRWPPRAGPGWSSAKRSRTALQQTSPHAEDLARSAPRGPAFHQPRASVVIAPRPPTRGGRRVVCQRRAAPSWAMRNTGRHWCRRRRHRRSATALRSRTSPR